ncbi:MAG: ankyrin repeat domain-containing protein [Pseudomonadota bacterium]
MNTTDPLDRFRRQAKDLRKGHEAGDARAVARLKNFPPRRDHEPLKHADYLRTIALEQGFLTWPALKLAVETQGLDRAQKQQRLGRAMHFGQFWVVDQLLAEAPDLAEGNLGLACGFYDLDAVRAAIAEDAAVATRKAGFGPPLIHLCRSKMIHHVPDREAAMLAIADLLLAHGADVNAGVPAYVDSDYNLPPLYYALGHAGNVVLARWLLQNGANPNDNESLYHATELGHRDGLKLLLEFGAEPNGTNALLRAMDFHDHEAVELLLAHGAQADDYNDAHIAGEAPWVVPALFHAARRMVDARMVKLLIDAGARPEREFEGATSYGHARVFGHQMLAQTIAAKGPVPALSAEEEMLAAAAEGRPVASYIDPARLPAAYENLIRALIWLPGKLDHVKRLVAIGVPYDRPDSEGLTPVQIAGWEGLPEEMAYLLSLKPDLGHVNGYGGTLLGTIVHGSENNPARGGRDYIACLRLALVEGVALPKRTIELAGDPECAAFLADWADAHPGQVVEGGVG